MAVEIGALRALLSLDSAAFDKGAKRAQASMNGLQRSLSKSAARMKSVGRKMTTRMTLPLAGLAAVAVKSSLATVDAQSKMAQSLNTSTKSMQVLDRAADRAGISTGELEQIGRQLTKRLSQAATGTGPAIKALDKLGLKASDLAKLDLDQKIAVINKAITDTIPETEQAAVAMALFGDRAGIMAGRLDPATLASAADEIERFGIAVTEVDANKIEAANDAISAIGLVSRGLANQIAVALAPTLQSIAEWIADIGTAFSALSPQMKKFVGIAAVVAAALGPLALTLGFVAAGLAALASPIGLAVLGFGAVAGVAVAVAANWDDLTARFPILETGLTKLKGVFSAVWTGIKEIAAGAAEIVKGVVETIAGLFTGDLTRAINGLTSVWNGWKAVTDAALNAVLGVIEAIVPGFKQAVANIIAAVSALPGKLKQWGMDAIQSFVDGIKEKWTELKAYVASIFSLSDPEIDPVGKAVKLGRDMGGGLILGLQQTEPDLKAKTRAYVKAMEDEARDVTKTQSPSRVWMRLGRDLMDGLGIGIADRAQSAAKQAAAAAQTVSNAAGSIAPVVSDIPQDLANAADATADLGSNLASMFTSAAQGAKTFSGFLANVANQLKNMLLNQAFKTIFSGVGGGGGLFGGIGKIFGFASGTNFAPGGLSVVGEEGPELVNLPRGSQVFSNPVSRRMVQGGAVELFIRTDPGVTVETVRNEAGVMIRQAAPQIQSGAVSATMKRLNQTKSGWS